MKNLYNYFFKIGIAVLICLTLWSCNQTKDEGRAKYIFVMIGDGMGASNVAAAESYLSYKAGQLGGTQLLMTQFPVLGMATTHSANMRITDSAAGGTAIATGYKTNNGFLGMDANKEYVESMAYTLHDAGYQVGLLTSVPVNHATPAAFFAHQDNRDNYYEISLEIPESGFEFFAGSGILLPNRENNNLENIEDVLQRKGYDICHGIPELKASPNETKAILLPSSNNETLNYEVERETEEERLADIMKAAIEYLGEDQPFFFMCEGGEIDWYAHSNNVMGMIDAIVRFDEAIDVAYNFYLAHPDETLIIVTADHETGGIALSGDGYQIDWAGLEAEYPDINQNLPVLQHREKSTRHNISWTTDGHAGSPVPVYAIGKGAEKFAGRIDNTDIYKKVVCNDPK